MKCSQILVLLLSVVLYGEVGVHFTSGEIVNGNTTPSWIAGPVVRFKNSTRSRYDMGGFRFNTKEVWWNQFNGETAVTLDSLGDIYGDGTLWQEIRFNGNAREDSRIVIPDGETLQNKNLGFNGITLDVGADGTPISTEILLKTGAKGEISFGASDEITLSDISSITGNSAYYDTDYRYFDSSSVKLGREGGAMFDNFKNETQVILPLHSEPFTVNNVEGSISPDYATPLYWITMVAMQEYFNMDYQFLSGIFAKETDVGREAFWVRGFWDNTDQAFGCGEVENTTFAAVALAYPYLFKDHFELLSKTKSVNDMVSGAAPVSASELGAYYMGADKYTMEHPYVVNSIVSSAHVFFWIWDYLVYSEKVCLNEVLDQQEDSYFVSGLVSLLYNRGLGYGRDSVLWVDNYHEYLGADAASKLPDGFANYQDEVLVGLYAMEAASKKAATDLSVPLYDTTVTLELLKTLFYGKDGSVSVQGEGGFLLHFDVDRAAFNSDLEAGFGALESHWGNGTISFRHDIITLLRLLKPHFDFSRKRPLDSESQSFIIKRNLLEGETGCDGEAVDRRYPSAKLNGVLINGTEMRVELALADNDEVASLFWTSDPSWELWMEGSVRNGIGHISDNSGDLQSGDSIWVMVTDLSGNSVVRTVTLESMGTVAVKSLSLKRADLGVRIFSDRMTITHSLNGTNPFSAKLYDIRGREVMELFNGTLPKSGTSLAIDTRDLSAGIYFVRMKVGTNLSTVRLRKM